MLAEGAAVRAYDPAAEGNARSVLGDSIEYSSSSIQAISGADCCIIVTEWGEFKKLEPHDFSLNMKKPVVVDGRRIYDPSKFSEVMYATVGLSSSFHHDRHASQQSAV